MRPLPKIMVAPNGARRGKADHPALPITDDEIIEVAIAAHDAGADGIHIHIRDEAGQHLIDAERYRALLDRLQTEVPKMYLQVTSETAEKYEASEQQDMVRELRPDYVSVGLREMVRQPTDWPAARDFYHWARGAGVEIQHILYSPDDVLNFIHALSDGSIPGQDHLVLFVQGTYANGSKDSVDLEEYLTPLATMDGFDFDWMVCAFGAQETSSLARAVELGGKARVGFENSLQNADGSRAKNNAERVREVSAAILGL